LLIRLFSALKPSHSENAGLQGFFSSILRRFFLPEVRFGNTLGLGFQSLVVHSLGSKVRVRVIHPEQIFRGDVGIGPNFPQSVYMAHQSNTS